MTATNTFKRVSVLTDGHLTATERQRILMVVNENKPEFLGRKLNAGKIKLMVTLIEGETYEVVIYNWNKYGLLGAYESKHINTVKLS